jgi:hypothetical protein
MRFKKQITQTFILFSSIWVSFGAAAQSYQCVPGLNGAMNCHRGNPWQSQAPNAFDNYNSAYNQAREREMQRALIEQQSRLNQPQSLLASITNAFKTNLSVQSYSVALPINVFNVPAQNTIVVAHKMNCSIRLGNCVAPHHLSDEAVAREKDYCTGVLSPIRRNNVNLADVFLDSENQVIMNGNSTGGVSFNNAECLKVGLK